MKVRQVTIWKRWNPEKCCFEHNHLEYGWAGGPAPEPRSQCQKKDWKDQIWRRKHTFVNEQGKVVC